MRIRRDVGELLARAYRSYTLPRRHDNPEFVLATALATARARKYALLITADDQSGFSARVVQPSKPDQNFCIWFGTSPRSRKADQLAAHPACSIVYQDDRRTACVVAVGEAAPCLDAHERARRFPPVFWAFFPNGPDHDFALYRFTANRLEVADFRRRIAPDPFGLSSYVLVRAEAGWQRGDPTSGP